MGALFGSGALFVQCVRLLPRAAVGLQCALALRMSEFYLFAALPLYQSRCRLRFRCHHALTLVLVQLNICPPISVWGGPGSRVLPGLRPALQQWNSSFSSVRRLVPALATVSDGVVDVFSLAEGALHFAQTVALAVTGACSCSSGSLRFRCLLARRRCSCSLRRQCAWQSHVQCFTLQNYVHLLPPVQ